MGKGARGWRVMVYDKISGARTYVGPAYPRLGMAVSVRDSYRAKARDTEDVVLVRDIPGLETTPLPRRK